MKIEIFPNKTVGWSQFVTTHPRFSVGLDGYVAGPPMYSEDTLHANFNHHENVNRLATRCTASQVAMAIKQGFLSAFAPDEITLYVNDCDQDVCTALWLFKNWERVSGQKSEPLISRLVFNVDMLDTCAGAFPIDPSARIMQETGWIFEPYTDARLSGKVLSASSRDMETIIDAVLGRIDAYCLGQGGRKKPDDRYDVLYRSDRWALVREYGNEARTAMRRDGIQSFVSLRGEANGRFIYSVGNLTPFGGIHLACLYDALNAAEQIFNTDANRWGGSDSCGGSPRDGGSSLSPSQLQDMVNGFLAGV